MLFLEGEINLSVSHIEPVYKTMWIQSKTLSEFFTASTDGTVSTQSNVTWFLSNICHKKLKDKFYVLFKIQNFSI